MAYWGLRGPRSGGIEGQEVVNDFEDLGPLSPERGGLGCGVETGHQITRLVIVHRSHPLRFLARVLRRHVGVEPPPTG